MSRIKPVENTEVMAWGGLKTGDTQVAPDGREWEVTYVQPLAERTRGKVSIWLWHAATKEEVKGEPLASAETLIRPRPTVLLREALESIVHAFPDVTVDAPAPGEIRDGRAQTCDVCGAWVISPARHDVWHDALQDRLADLDHAIGKTDDRVQGVLRGMN